MPEEFRFDSYEDAVQFFKDKVDDIDEVQIPIPDELWSSLSGAQLTGGFVLVKMVGGVKAIDATTAEKLLNDGILQRLNIDCKLHVIPKHR